MRVCGCPGPMAEILGTGSDIIFNNKMLLWASKGLHKKCRFEELQPSSSHSLQFDTTPAGGTPKGSPLKSSRGKATS